MAKAMKKELTPEEKLEAALVPVEEWPYKVPKNWCWTRMSYLYAINPRNEADDQTDAAFVPMEKISAGYSNDFEYEVQPWQKAKRGHTQFADGDVAFAKISPCFENRKSMIVKGLPNGIGGGTTELIILRQPMVEQKYTYWLVSTDKFIRGGCNTYSGTVGQQRISMDYVRNYMVPLPPLSEQHRIIESIESLFAKLDEAKEAAQAVVDGFEDRKAAILHKAFTGELTAEWRLKNNVSFKLWQEVFLKDIVKGFKYGSSEKSDYNNEGLPVLRIPNIGEGKIDFSDMKYFSEPETDSSYYVHENDILIIRSNGSRDLVGKCALVPRLDREYAYASFLIKVLPSTSVKPEFLVMYLNSIDARRQMFAKAKSSAGIHNINSKELGAISLLLPSIDEQEAVVKTVLKLIDSEIQSLEIAEQVIDQIDTMKKSILARAFRGELGTNDPNDEPAMELLKRVLDKKN